MRIRIFLILIIIQVFVILSLGYKIYQKHKNILGAVSLNPIQKNDIDNNPGSGLKYFFEPKANSIQHPLDWLPFKADSTINLDSLNAMQEYSIQKLPYTFRIITLGDSFTFGVNVDTQYNWPSQLEKLLNEKLKCQNIQNFEIINLGVGGYDFEYAVERYRLRGIKYNPDLVLWLMTDFDRIYEKLIPLNDKYFKEFKQSGELSELVKQGKPYEAFALAKEQVKKEFGEENVYKYQKKAIRKINDYYNGELVLIPLQNVGQKNKSLLYEFAQIRNKTVIFDKLSDIYSIKNATLSDSHPSEIGHQIIAQDIFNYLNNNTLIPCN